MPRAPQQNLWENWQQELRSTRSFLAALRLDSTWCSILTLTHNHSLTSLTHSLTHSLKNTNTNSQHTGTAGSTFPRYHSSSGIRSRLHLLLPQTKSYSTVVTYIARDRSRTVFELPHRARNSRSIWTVLTVSWD